MNSKFFNRLFYGVVCVLTAIPLLLLMGLTAVDVVGRYVFNAPVRGAYEAVTALMAVIVFFSLPLVTLRRDHLRAGFFEDAFPKKFDRARSILVDVFCIVLLLLASWQLAVYAENLRHSGERLEAIGLPLFVLVWIMAVFSFISVVAGCVAIATKTNVISGENES